MNLPKIAKNVASCLAGLALTASAMAAPTYLFKIYLPGLCESNTCPPAPASTDPYWSNVGALLHMDGANGSTTFTDQIGNSFGDYGGGSSFGVQGYLDEIRVTNGVARYSSSAPVPSAEFPNH